MGAIYDRLTFVNGTTPSLNASNLNSQQKFMDFLDRFYFLIDDQDLTYTGNDLTNVKEYIATKLFRDTTNTYSSGQLSTVNEKYYDTDGITKLYERTGTMAYTAGVLTGITWVEV